MRILILIFLLAASTASATAPLLSIDVELYEPNGANGYPGRLLPAGHEDGQQFPSRCHRLTTALVERLNGPSSRCHLSPRRTWELQTFSGTPPDRAGSA